MKVYLGDTELDLIRVVNVLGDVDLSKDTVSEETLIQGYTAHNSKGEIIVGINPYEKLETDTAVSNIAAAIASKGVPIPSDYTLNDLASLIYTINGSGGNSNISIRTVSNTDGTQNVIITEII